MEERDIAILIDGLKKRYRLGIIGGGTLQSDIQSWWARKRGKEDPNSLVGSKQYERNATFMALNGIDLTIYKGERLGIIGHNGAGKSTLLKLLSRVTAPTEGRICIDGRIASMLEVGTGFNPELTGRENIYLNGAILGMTKEEVDIKMEEIIDFSECRQFIDTPVKRYSSGMYVKLAFSVAAHLDSEIMIMDEVLAVGDMAFQKKCLDKMIHVSQSQGRTVLYVSHNMNTIRKLCDRCIVLDKGRVIFNGGVEEAIGVYMGTSGNNDLSVNYDFTGKERLFHFGKEVYINRLSLVNKEESVFTLGEKIEVEVSLSSTIEVENLYFVFGIKDKNNVDKIATSLSEPFSIGVEENKVIRFSFGTDGLVEEEYCLVIEVVTCDKVGNYLAYDNPGVAMPFQIVKNIDSDVLWSSRFWGKVRLEDAAIIK